MMSRLAALSRTTAPLFAVVFALLARVDVATKALAPWLARLKESRIWADLTNAYGAVGVTTKGLREKRARLAEESAAILKAAAEDGREILRAEEEEHYQNLEKEINALGKHIELRERQEALEAKLAESQGRQTDPGQPAGKEDRRIPEDARLFRLRRGQEDNMEALRTWLLCGSPESPTPEQFATCQRLGFDPRQRQVTLQFSRQAMRMINDPAWEYRAAQGTTSAGVGGALVADELMGTFERALLAYGGMREVATILRTSTGASLPIPMADDTSNKGALVAENIITTEQAITFSQLVLGSYLFSSKYLLVSVQLLQDSAINVAEFIGSALGERIGRILNQYFTTGSGNSQPNGIVTAATSGKAAASGQTASVLYADLVDLEHSVNAAYRRPNGRWMFADSTLKALKKMVDGQYRPLWSAGLAVREPDTILGYPYVINDDMADLGTSAKAILFGDLSKYIIRDVTQLTLIRADELFAQYHQVAFLAFSRNDGDLKDAGTNPVKYFACAAS